MFPARYFPNRFFAGRYWPHDGVPVVDSPGLEYTATGRLRYAATGRLQYTADEGSIHYTAPAEDA